MRVLLADKLPDRARVRLATAGCEVRAGFDLHGAALAAALADFDPVVLVVRSTRVERAQITGAAALALVVRAGAGVNTIDLDACSERGVYVANCPGKNAVAVAELTLGLLLALDRHIPDNVADFRAGSWNKAAYSRARGLRGRTLGLLGLGQIGSEVARRARAFGMRVVGWSRSLTDERAAELGIGRASTPQEVAAACDALSLHLALTPETFGLVGESILGALRADSYLVNTARAELIDEAALARAVTDRGIRAALDVISSEPSGGTGAVTHPLQALPGVYVTHHIGASTDEAQMAVADEVCTIVEDFRRSGRARNTVNVADSGAGHVLVVRHLDRVGVLAGVLGDLREANVNVEEMDNTIFRGGSGAVARIHVDGALSDALLDTIRSHPHVLQATLLRLEEG